MDMDIQVVKDYEAMSQKAAQIIKETIEGQAQPVLGLATGSTPVGTYEELIRLHKEEGLDFSKVISVNLDEYIGLAPDHPQSYRYFMNDKLFSHVNIERNNTHVPNGMADDLEAEGKRYDAMIRDLGHIDLQLLGIGANGHIGFNEPDKTLRASTHVTDLTPSTIQANARFFDSIDDVPTTAISMGMGSILFADKILLLASGEAKADAIRQLTTDDIDPMCPATLLKVHPNVIILVDEAAASKI